LLVASFALGHEHAANLIGPILVIGGLVFFDGARWHTQRRLACC